MSRYWFRPKLYGIGATPTTWQGWALVGLYLCAIVTLALVMRVNMMAGAEKPLSFIAIVVVLTAALVWISWKKTDGVWRWRWGQD
jgi:hypothetical protein